MLHKTIIATFLFVCILIANAEPDAKPEAKAGPDANPEAKPEPNPSRYKLFDDEEEQYKSNLKAQGDEIDTEESRIVQDVYSPDYYEPNIILDYRYLKTGGRRYTRSDGGQILILPRRNNLPIAYNDYDELLEYLRLKREADKNKIMRDSSRRRNKNGFEQYLDTTPGLYELLEGNVKEYEDKHWQDQMYKLNH